jgi:hypothetical protein
MPLARMRLSMLVCLSAVTLSMMNCRQSEPEVAPVQELFPITYKFINASGTQLRAINFTTSTYFPKLNKALVHYQNVENIAPSDTVSSKIDTSAVTKSFGYPGCMKKLEVEVWQPLLNKRTYYVSTWVTSIDTIRTKADATTYFIWPQDTVKAHKLDQHYINY